MERSKRILIEVGASTSKLGHAGKAAPLVEVATDARLRQSMLAAGTAVEPCLLGPFLKKLLLGSVMTGVDGVLFTVLLNTAAKETLRDAVIAGLSPGTVSVVNSQVCALVAAGYHTGLVLDVGYAETRCVPIVEGVILETAVIFAPLSAQLIATEYRKARAEVTRGDISDDDVAHILSTQGNIAASSEAGSTADPHTSAYEVLFNGKEPSCDSFTLQGTVFDVLAKVEMVNRKGVAQCVVLAGGVCSVPGMRKRLAQELLALSQGNSGGEKRAALRSAIAPSLRLANTKYPEKMLAYVGASLMVSTPNLS